MFTHSATSTSRRYKDIHSHFSYLRSLWTFPYLCGFRSWPAVIAEVHSAIFVNGICKTAVAQGSQTALFWWKGKQYIAVTWFRVRKGLNDHEYEVNLPLAYTFWSSELIKTAICWGCRNASLPIQSIPRMVQNCSLARERVKYWALDG